MARKTSIRANRGAERMVGTHKEINKVKVEMKEGMYNAITYAVLTTHFDSVHVSVHNQSRRLADLYNENEGYDFYDLVLFLGMTDPTSLPSGGDTLYYFHTYNDNFSSTNKFKYIVNIDGASTVNVLLYLHSKEVIQLDPSDLELVKELNNNYTVSDANTQLGEDFKTIAGSLQTKLDRVPELLKDLDLMYSDKDIELLLDTAKDTRDRVINNAVEIMRDKQVGDYYFIVTNADTMFSAISDKLFKMTTLDNVAVIIQNNGKNYNNDTYYIYTRGDLDARELAQSMGGKPNYRDTNNFAIAFNGSSLDEVFNILF